MAWLHRMVTTQNVNYTEWQLQQEHHGGTKMQRKFEQKYNVQKTQLYTFPPKKLKSMSKQKPKHISNQEKQNDPPK